MKWQLHLVITYGFTLLNVSWKLIKFCEKNCQINRILDKNFCIILIVNSPHGVHMQEQSGADVMNIVQKNMFSFTDQNNLKLLNWPLFVKLTIYRHVRVRIVSLNIEVAKLLVASVVPRKFGSFALCFYRFPWLWSRSWPDLRK